MLSLESSALGFWVASSSLAGIGVLSTEVKSIPFPFAALDESAESIIDFSRAVRKYHSKRILEGSDR